MPQFDDQLAAATASPAFRGLGAAPLVIASLVLMLTLGITYTAWSSAQRDAESRLREAFDYRAHEVSVGITRQVRIHEQRLRGARGYLRGSVNVSRQQFASYYRSLRLGQSMPGLNGLALITVLNPTQIRAHEHSVRAEGYPDYAVSPPNSAPLTTALTHFEPLTPQNAGMLGMNAYAEPVRRHAMDLARDSGEAILSEKLKFIYTDPDDSGIGVLMYLAIYRPGTTLQTVGQRRAALLGWAFAPLRMSDLMRGVDPATASRLDLSIYDGAEPSADSLLFRAAEDARPAPPKLRTAVPIDVGGRTWTIEMASGTSLEEIMHDSRPAIIAVTGVLLGVLASMVIWLLASSRHHAVQLASSMTEQLRSSRDRIAADQRRMTTILETAYDGFLAIDSAGHITDWNARATQIFGLSAQEAIGLHAEQLLPEQHRTWFRDAYATFARKGTLRLFGRHTETDALHCSGKLIPVEIAVSPLPGANGTGVTIFVRDITPRRDAEALELQRQLRLDEARRALNRAQKLEAVGQLTGGVAHDFNNLLHIIRANVQMMLHKDQLVPSPRLHGILDAVERGAKLVGQLLAFARRQPLHPDVVNVETLFDRIDSLMLRAVGDAIEIERIMTPDPWPILLDQNQFEHVLLNLVINARDAINDTGRITLQVRNLRLHHPDGVHESIDAEPVTGEYVSIAVSDTGCGMPQEVMDRAFEPFFTTKAEGKGTGLGLSMAHGFVRQSGGYIRMDSKVGAGTTVTLYLPRHHPPHQAAAQPETLVAMS